MSFYKLIHDAIDDTLLISLRAFAPELVICATIVLLLLARMILTARSGRAFALAFAGSLTALYFAVFWHCSEPEAALGSGVQTATPIFTGMLVYDKFSVYLRGLLLLFVVLFVVLTRISRVPEDDDATEFFVLIFGATLGMCLMVAANHMFIVFLGVEMASVPSYALAGMVKTRRQSSEAALKFAVFGGATAGVMLYGISLLAGALGSVHLPTMAAQLAGIVDSGVPVEKGPGLVLVLGGLMVAVGLAFKLSAVPFHFWAPDVFEGASAEVGAFLSVASKAAAIGLLARLAIAFAEVEPARVFISGLLVLLAALTCTFGNLAAYGQTNIKRLLAYSTIAHAGYMMMPMAAAVILAGTSKPDASEAVAAMIFYAAIYLFMNLGAFAAVAFLRNASGSEQIADYAGLVRRSPGVAVCFSIILFSLIGLPPLAGFAAKFAVFASLYQANLLGLLAIGVLNTVLGLFYYLRVVRVMILTAEPADRPAPTVPLWSASGLYCLAIALALGALFLWWGPLDWAKTATAMLFS
jgi:NADH-quinone oxidoreductase subunit N